MTHTEPAKFFIIGSPKCGTTSMADWISTHPNICMSAIKEPNYFSSDLRMAKTFSEKEYRSLFRGNLSINTRWVAEASAIYFHSQIAVPKIEQTFDGSRYLVLLRNPSEMVVSLHKQLFFVGIEDSESFDDAWNSIQDRREHKLIPKFCAEPKFLDYEMMGNLGDHLERLYSVVSKERVLVLLLDDLRDFPRESYLKVLNFLDLPDDGRVDFSVANVAKWPRSRFISLAVRKLSDLRRFLRVPMLVKGSWVAQKIIKYNIAPSHRFDTPSNVVMDEIKNKFSIQIDKLEKITGRDLSSWRD